MNQGKCIIIFHADKSTRLEVFNFDNEKKEMLDRAIELLGAPLTADSKDTAGQIIDGDESMFPTHEKQLSSISLFGTNNGRVHVYLGRYGKLA